MPGPEIEVLGTGQFAAAGRALHRGAAALPRVLAERLKVAGDATERDVERGAEDLPSSGGLAALVRASTFDARVRIVGRDVALNVEADGDLDLDQIDGGVLFHPVFGRKPIVRQSITARWFSRPAVTKGVPRVRTAASLALQDVRSIVERSAE